MRIDLHTHSDRSDGTLAPAALIRAAADARLDVVALTDHDTADGWAEAAREAHRIGVELVLGLEISCRFQSHGVHLLAYGPDPAYPPLREELARIIEGRGSRLPAMLAALRGLGIEILAEDVERASTGAIAVGRPHVADALVALGVVADRDEAFARYLSPGRPAFVDRYAAEVTSMIAIVADAGGVAVLAHPWGRQSERALTPGVLADLAAAGLAGIEVDHEDHSPPIRDRLRVLASELGLVATGSSDFHGAGKTGHELGCNTTDPGEFARLMERASTAGGLLGGRPGSQPGSPPAGPAGDVPAGEPTR